MIAAIGYLPSTSVTSDALARRGYNFLLMPTSD
jgi:hypothetical protein